MPPRQAADVRASGFRRFLIFGDVLAESLFPLRELLLHRRFDLPGDGEHQVGPDGKAAGRSEEIHGVEEGLAVALRGL